MMNSEFLLSSKEGGSNIFARGFCSAGKRIIDDVEDRLRKLADDCKNIQAFFMTHSVGGGTGSGLGCLILERLSVNYRKKTKVGFEIYPSVENSASLVEPYNSLLATHHFLDDIDLCLLFDNEALYNICYNKLNLYKPTYPTINRLISKVIAGYTSHLRYEAEIHRPHDFTSNLVPFPRLHFLFTAMSPIIPAANFEKDTS